MPEKDAPIVSVCMITYNHEPFIAQAIEGVLMQETDFPIELVIGEDFSTDRTREICEYYASANPGVVRLLERTSNLGMIPNFVDTLNHCRSIYVALCEGDDFWSDPNKLQMQVQFLEANPSYIGTCSNVKIWNEDLQTEIGQPRYVNYPEEVTFAFDDVLHKTMVYTPSAVFRNREIDLDLLKPEYVFGDVCLWLMLLDQGPIRFFNKKLAVYRVHSAGATRTIDGFRFQDQMVSFLEEFDKRTGYRHTSSIRKRIKRAETLCILLHPRTSWSKKLITIFGYFSRSDERNIRELKKLFGYGFRPWIERISNFRKRLAISPLSGRD